MVGGAYTHLDDMLASQYSRLTRPNILLVKVVSVGRTFWLLVPCMRKHPLVPPFQDCISETMSSLALKV